MTYHPKRLIGLFLAALAAGLTAPSIMPVASAGVMCIEVIPKYEGDAPATIGGGRGGVLYVGAGVHEPVMAGAGIEFDGFTCEAKLRECLELMDDSEPPLPPIITQAYPMGPIEVVECILGHIGPW